MHHRAVEAALCRKGQNLDFTCIPFRYNIIMLFGTNVSTTNKQFTMLSLVSYSIHNYAIWHKFCNN